MSWRQIWKPESFHGEGKKGPFFEGWYVKQISADASRKLALIPGMFLGSEAQESHAFVQVLDGTTAESYYIRFPLAQFSGNDQRFEATVGDNHFSHEGVRLNIDTEVLRCRGELRFESLTPWPVTTALPGIMGPFSFLPKMECNHGLLSFDHRVSGQLEVQGETWDFSGGRGYLEKDWGRSFPSSYVWMQCNHFATEGVSLSASVANIPWGGLRFRGFIIGLWWEQRLVPFATWNGASLETLEVDDQEVRMVVRRGRWQLEVTAARAKGGLLKAPYGHAMQERVSETMTASVHVSLCEKKGGLLHERFAERGGHAAMEVQGLLEEIAQLG